MGVYIYLHEVLISTLDADEWSASRHGRFIPKESLPLLIEHKTGWSPEQLLKQWRRGKYSLMSLTESNPDFSLTKLLKVTLYWLSYPGT
jgi:hypothetical protein